MDQTSQSEPVDIEPFDAFHSAAAGRGLSSQLYAEAFGEEYPVEVDPSSSCTWSVLGEMVKRLRLRPEGLLVDLGCGRRGTGLWLARVLGAAAWRGHLAESRGVGDGADTRVLPCRSGTRGESGSPGGVGSVGSSQ